MLGQQAGFRQHTDFSRLKKGEEQKIRALLESQDAIFF